MRWFFNFVKFSELIHKLFSGLDAQFVVLVIINLFNVYLINDFV